MANEVIISGTLAFASAGVSVTLSNSSTPSPAEVESLEINMNVGTGDESVTLGDLSAPGYIMVKNLDATNYVQMGPDGSSYPIKIPAGEAAGPMLWNAAAVHLKANSSACNCVIVITGAPA